MEKLQFLKSNKTIDKNILAIAGPAFIGFLAVVVFEIIDVFWIGKINPASVAAAAAGNFIVWTVYSLMNTTSTGCQTLISQFYGAGKQDEAHQVAIESFWLSMIATLVIMVVIYIFAPQIFSAMGLDEETNKLATSYIRGFMISLPIIYTFMQQGNVFNAYGDTKTAMITMGVALFLNIVLDPIFMFGWLGMPKLGVAGVPAAVFFSEGAGVLLRHYHLRRKQYVNAYSSYFKITTKYWKEILRIGVPSALTNATWNLVFPALTVIITRFGMEPLAGFNVANRFEGFAYFLSISISIGVAAYTGQKFGANEKKEVFNILGRGLIIVTLALMPFSLLFILIPETLVGFLNSDPNIIRHGTEYLRIVGYLEIFMGWELVIEGAFNGIGNTKPYMWVRIPLVLGRVPLAYFLAVSLNLGVNGVWWAISLTMLIKGVVLAFVFFTNKKNKELLKV